MRQQEDIFIENRTFKELNSEGIQLKKGEYLNCSFVNCNLSERDLSSFLFEECEFINCNLSSAKLINSSFQNILFKNSKLLGVDFSQCNPFLLTFKFEECNLSYSNFFELNLKATLFDTCILENIDFTSSNLQQSVFENCKMNESVFEQSNLSQVNFTNSTSLSIDPNKNILKKTQFSKENAFALLQHIDIIIE